FFRGGGVGGGGGVNVRQHSAKTFRKVSAMFRIDSSQMSALRQRQRTFVRRELVHDVEKLLRLCGKSPVSAADEHCGSAIECCSSWGIVCFSNIKRIALLKIIAPERLRADGSAMMVLQQRQIEEARRIELLYEMGVFDGIPVGGIEDDCI
ncbi:MAG: hypothetical protein U0894_00085, partial [Pirellulales bacterium]